jgi:hypothetical protein
MAMSVEPGTHSGGTQNILLGIRAVWQSLGVASGIACTGFPESGVTIVRTELTQHGIAWTVAVGRGDCAGDEKFGLL